MIPQSRAEQKLCNLLVAGFRANLADRQSLYDELTRLQTQLSRLRRHRQWLQLQSEFAIHNNNPSERWHLTTT